MFLKVVLRDGLILGKSTYQSRKLKLKISRNSKIKLFICRYLIEWMHLHGLYLHYPNLMRNRGFSTNHREPGLHTGGLDNTYNEKTMDIGLRVKRDRKYDIGLFNFDVMSKTAPKHFYDLKRTLDQLPTVDIYHRMRTSRKELQHYPRDKEIIEEIEPKT